jgi:predicted RNA polymerase sigma factor
VAEYTGLNFFEIAELDYVQYLVWLRDAYIHRLSQSEEGQKYLDNAWRMEQTEPDRAALRKKLRKESTTDGK